MYANHVRYDNDDCNVISCEKLNSSNCHTIKFADFRVNKDPPLSKMCCIYCTINLFI